MAGIMNLASSSLYCGPYNTIPIDQMIWLWNSHFKSLVFIIFQKQLIVSLLAPSIYEHWPNGWALEVPFKS
jgi:hypothetical protein